MISTILPIPLETNKEKVGSSSLPGGVNLIYFCDFRVSIGVRVVVSRIFGQGEFCAG